MSRKTWKYKLGMLAEMVSHVGSAGSHALHTRQHLLRSRKFRLRNSRSNSLSMVIRESLRMPVVNRGRSEAGAYPGATRAQNSWLDAKRGDPIWPDAILAPEYFVAHDRTEGDMSPSEAAGTIADTLRFANRI